ncbi:MULTISPECIES: (d)CMP kinase [Cupriavidus]|uniref:Cytidylate kinase n=2 Tax=Cupriavidus pinatubonensis TaxID=248026 RepID=KCY_CUPPJ|nr:MULTISPECIES: (d)CMP kinase [Cupriavidus]Q46Y52.1 RecName: Full=Cytidylate kinase; Short=CK; AltName: Full=Cytidine monophosphate kinase; Short=CMP kinase [Cupriavidus pinatubonensis JMP134]QYY30787.1 (d)CMP kinase [Cupriavidus pinatubonensis]TPQ43281.1 cytidylate kinase [Cupriavidus pinatubonensis]CAG9171778.1 Cytidylate kinase [Cupriavidus pinatubonensis]
MTIVHVITIDGPTASGKGTVAHKVADAVGYHLLDSGALYRLVALASDRIGVDIEDVDGLAKTASRLDVKFGPDRVWLSGEEVSLAIRAEAIGNRASAIAVHQPVRDALTKLQRDFRKLPGLVADGRDMGTVIFPDAQLKVFLTASVEARARRRYKQLIDKGISANIEDLLRDLEARDARDRNRAAAPLRPAEDAKLLDTSDMTVDQAVAQVLEWFAAVRKA